MKTGDRYINKEDRSVWEIVGWEEGKRILVRKVTDDSVRDYKPIVFETAFEPMKVEAPPSASVLPPIEYGK
jgi:hypothetical protein